jgi:chorismate mutase
MISIRGAITTEHNSKTEILEATKEVLESIMSHNKLEIDQIIQILFSTTNDLDEVYPAVAAREMGLTSAALMCFQEMYVKGSLEKCIRVSVLADSDELNKQNVKHQYLRRARCLRIDLIEE